MLSFVVPPNQYYVTSETHYKTLQVVRPTKQAWLNFRNNDVRRTRIQDRFASRVIARDSSKNYSESKKIFDEDYADSDGDGYSNLFERAMGLDSLGPDKPQHLPIQLADTVDGRQRISFIKYRDPIGSTGEDLRYVVEKSTNLRTWSLIGVNLESARNVDLGGGMDRVTFSTASPLRKGGKNFLRVRVYKP